MVRKIFETSRASAGDAYATSTQAVEQARALLEEHQAAVASIQVATEAAQSRLNEEV